MNQLAIKKYVKNKVKRTFVKAHVTIPQIVLNKLANGLYSEFEKLSDEEQEKLLFSEDLVIKLWEKHMDKMKTELLEEMWVKSCLFFYYKLSPKYCQKPLKKWPLKNPYLSRVLWLLTEIQDYCYINDFYVYFRKNTSQIKRTFFYGELPTRINLRGVF